MFLKKLIARKNLILLLGLIFVLLFSAARPLQETPGEWLDALVTFYVSLAGFAAFISFFVNILKRFGVVSDGQADAWVKWLNLAGLVIVGVMQVFAPGFISPVDQILGLLAQLGGVIFPILALLFSWPLANAASGFTYDKVRGFKFLALGYSHSK